jgi:hypothetical protein
MHLKGSGGENQKACKTPTKSEFLLVLRELEARRATREKI